MADAPDVWFQPPIRLADGVLIGAIVSRRSGRQWPPPGYLGPPGGFA